MNLDQSLISGQGVTLGKAFSMGGETAVIGMSIVFSVLIILMVVLYLFRVIFYREKKTIKPVETVLPGPEPLLTAQPETAEEDEEELIAIITAAIAASLNTSTYKLNIKSIRRVDPHQSAWNRAGLNETINNRF